MQKAYILLVPVQKTTVIGDVLRIRQILTNLISNAIKFTHEGKVGIKLYLVHEPFSFQNKGSHQNTTVDQSSILDNICKDDKCSSTSESGCDKKSSIGQKHGGGPCHNHTQNDEPKAPIKKGDLEDGDKENHYQPRETSVWIRCDVYDTGIGIPDHALPTLFKKYMQVSADTARKYGGTGLGLAICKQLVELMGGQLTVSSREHHGSTFTFVLPYKVSPVCDSSDDPDDMSEMADHDATADSNEDDASSGFFQFQPRTLGSLFSSNGPGRNQKLTPKNFGVNSFHNKLNELSKDPYSFRSNNSTLQDMSSIEDACSIADAAETSSEPECSLRCSPDIGNKYVVGIEKHIHDDYQCQNPCMHTTHSSRTSKNGAEIIETRNTPETGQMQMKSDRSSECSSSNSPEIPKSTSKPKILLVEDNKINVMVTRSMMKQLGYSIDVVDNGVEAVRAVQGSPYDLILMDVCMPVMDGLQATRLIRSFEETGNWVAAAKAGIELCTPSSDSSPSDIELKPSTKRMPIIAMTANALSESADDCFANGF
ncbi:unnamed protein product [Ilex paraguariensis]|uniref:histidine kinase n=1 Tax=Ilex paraguariensis TaxID=185542 RepID=A0ABC8U483_9AQUA